MAMNLQAVLRIAANVTGLGDLTKLEQGLKGAEKAATGAKQGFKAMVDSSAWQAAAAAAAGLGVAMFTSVRAAVEFESAMSDVRKVVDGLESPQALRDIGREIKSLAAEMPIAASGFAAIYAAAGRAGIARNEMRQFAIDVAKVATAFDMTAEEAGNAMAILRVQLGLTQPEIRRLTDQINYLDESVANVSASALMDFMQRSAAAGRAAGLAAEETASFGAAMLSAGYQADVAATTFLNITKALTRGASMTERQVEGFRRLGMVTTDAASKERELTAVVERESERRLAASRRETDGILKEINRRYRAQLQALQDGFDDESDAYREKLQDQADAQIKALDRMREREIEARGEISSAARAAINDDYDRRIDAIRDGLDDELQAFQRAQRDKQQAMTDQLEDQKELEVQAVQDRYAAVQRAEQERRQEATAAAKRQAKAIGDEWAKALSESIQSGGAQAILGVFERIAALPKAEQASVISDIFGDEARAAIGIIQDLDRLREIVRNVKDEKEFANSVNKEYGFRLGTLSAQAEILSNKMKNLSTEFGESMLPALALLNVAIGPIIDAFTWMLQNIPGLGPVLATITGAFVGLVALAPFITSFLGLLPQLKAALILLGNAGFVVAIKTALAGFLAWLTGTALPVLIGIFSGPVGWTVLAVAAVALMVGLFSKEITGFFNWLGRQATAVVQAIWKWGEPIRQFWASIWESLKTIAANAIAAIGNEIAWIMKNPMDAIMRAFVPWWATLFNVVLRKPVSDLIQWLSGAWKAIGQFFTLNVAQPLGKMWKDLMSFLPNAFKAAVAGVRNVALNMVNIIRNAVRNVLQFIADRINFITRRLNVLISANNRLSPIKIPVIPTLSVPRFAKGGYVTSATLAQIGEGGEPEYVIPESKMARASANYLTGGRGAEVLSAQPPMPSATATPATGGAVQIDIRTGPVVEMDGTRYVSVADLERAMRITAEGVIGRLRTPSARLALGLQR